MPRNSETLDTSGWPVFDLYPSGQPELRSERSTTQTEPTVLVSAKNNINVAVVPIPAHNCTGCINSGKIDPYNAIMRDVPCYRLPECNGLIWAEATKDNLAKYVASKLEV